MKRRDPGLEPELEAFLDPPKIERRAPPEVRARALARARAVVAAGGAIPTPPPALDSPAPVPVAVTVPVARRRVLIRVALAAIAITVGAVAARAALRSRAAHAPQVALPESPHAAPVARDERFVAPSGVSPTVAARPAETAKPARPARVDRDRDPDPFTVELELLQRAHAAYTRRDFSGALILVAQHARRFPGGRLAEQREALRVRSLVGSGRRDEAHRAALAFAVRFPRSVLLPRLEGAQEAGE